MSGTLDEENRSVDTHESVGDGEKNDVLSESTKEQQGLETAIFSERYKTERGMLKVEVSLEPMESEKLSEAAKKAKEEADRKAKEEADRKAKEEADRKAKEEANRRAKEEADRRAKEEADRRAKEEADRRAKEEADRRAREEATTTAAVTQATETQQTAPQSTETQQTAPQATEAQQAAPQSTETQQTVPQSTETQQTAPQATEAQQAAPQSTETQQAALQSTETQQASSQSAETEAPLPDTPRGRYDEMLSLMQGLSREIQSTQTGPIVLTGKQMKDLHRISLLRAPFFGASITNQDAHEAGRDDIITGEDLRNPSSIDAAVRRLGKETKKEKKMAKKLKKLAKKKAENLNARNETNYYLNTIAGFNTLNERLENGEYIDQTYALLPNVSPLIVDLCTKKNQKALEAGNRIQIMNNGKRLDVFPQSAVDSAGRAGGYLASCGAGYSNILEKLVVENTKMTQSQAKTMINTCIIGGALLAGYFLFTKKEGDSRKFSFPSLKTLAGIAAIPIVGNFVSQMTTGNSLLDNFSRLWRKGELPWSSSDNLEAHEQGASQQVMGQFVLLGVPKSVIKKYGTFNNSKLEKIDLGGLNEYFGTLENNPNISGDEKARIGMQRLAIEKIKNDNGASIALNNYIAGLGITRSELENDGNGNIDDRLSESRAKYQKMLDYISARGFLIDPSKKEKVMDALTKEKDVDDKLFDKLKEEGCFTPDPKDSRYAELIKLNVSNEKKIRFYEAYKKLCDEGTKFGQIKLEVVNNQIQLTSGAEEHKILLNTDNTIDNLVNVGGIKLEFKSEEELLRMGLFINYLRSTWWKETPDAQHKKNPFVLSGGIKFWEDLQFMKPGENKDTVLSSLVPFFSEMASKFPTIEAKANREFLKDYLNKLWENEHPGI